MKSAKRTEENAPKDAILSKSVKRMMNSQTAERDATAKDRANQRPASGIRLRFEMTRKNTQKSCAMRKLTVRSKRAPLIRKPV